MVSIKPFIDEAKRRLTENPFDEAHNLAHAEAVWQTAQDISGHIQEDVDLDALQVACYWHDVVINPPDKLHPAGENVNDTADYLADYLHQQSLPGVFITTVVDAVRHHQFDDTPVNLEGRVLWDADKLEPLNIDRWLIAKRAVETGRMPEATFDAYIQTGLEWLKVLRQKFQYDYSRHEFDRRLQAITSNPIFIKLARQKGIDINSLTRV